MLQHGFENIMLSSKILQTLNMKIKLWKYDTLSLGTSLLEYSCADSFE